jgi:FkbM family methyltransferase
MEMGLEELDAYLPDDPVILEAGACDGSDTVRFAERWPRGTVHAFEPIPDAYQSVVAKTQRLSNVHTYEAALSGETGRDEIHLSEDVSGAPRPDASSLLKPEGLSESWPTIVFRRTITVDTTTLDDWSDEQSIARIDLMWLDLQGMESQVLQAAPRTLAMTRAIYLELWREPMYHDCPTYSEVVAWMRAVGFRLVVDKVHRVSGNALFVNTGLV